MKLPAIFLLFFAPLFTLASITLTWNSLSGDEVLLNDSSTFAPADYYAQLIWTPEQTASEIDPFNPLTPIGTNEVVVASQSLNTFGINGLIISGDVALDNTLVGGFVYTRVFESANPQIGQFWGQSSNFGSNALNPAQGLTVTTSDPTTSNIHNPTGIVMNLQIIPEPGTLAMILMAVGGIVYKIRRRRS